MFLPHFKLTNLEKIFTGDIMDYLHVKFHQNWSILSTQNCVRKSKIRQKIPQKLSLSLRRCQNMAGTYEPWAEIPLGDSW